MCKRERESVCVCVSVCVYTQVHSPPPSPLGSLDLAIGLSRKDSSRDPLIQPLPCF